jgi:hypothetical protein
MVCSAGAPVVLNIVYRGQTNRTGLVHPLPQDLKEVKTTHFATVKACFFRTFNPSVGSIARIGKYPCFNCVKGKIFNLPSVSALQAVL